jgi:hypothetical protein
MLSSLVAVFVYPAWLLLLKPVNSHISLIEEIINKGEGKIVFMKTGPKTSRIPNGSSDPTIVDFISRNTEFPDEFYIGFDKDFPQVLVYIPFNSTKRIMWTQRYSRIDSDIKENVVSRIPKDFRADLLVSMVEEWHIFGRHANVLVAMFSKKNVSTEQVMDALILLKAIDVQINSRSSRIKPRQKLYGFEHSFVVCSCGRRPCRGFAGLIEKEFEDSSKICKTCNEKSRQLAHYYNRNY